jgi:hypothetical protein
MLAIERNLENYSDSSMSSTGHRENQFPYGKVEEMQQRPAIVQPYNSIGSYATFRGGKKDGLLGRVEV